MSATPLRSDKRCVRLGEGERNGAKPWASRAARFCSSPNSFSSLHAKLRLQQLSATWRRPERCPCLRALSRHLSSRLKVDLLLCPGLVPCCRTSPPLLRRPLPSSRGTQQLLRWMSSQNVGAHGTCCRIPCSYMFYPATLCPDSRRRDKSSVSCKGGNSDIGPALPLRVLPVDPSLSR